MAVQNDGPAPYAPTAAVLEVVESYRDRSPQTPFTLDTLTRLGITESLAPRTLQALKLLDFVDEQGEPTQAFVALKQAPQDEFRDRLAEMVRAAYAEVFAYRDPATDSSERVSDAFRVFKPPSMRDRMIRLFYGLCEQAGIIAEAPKIESQPNAGRVRFPRPGPGRTAARSQASTASSGELVERPPSTPRQSTSHATVPQSLHPALAGLLALIPPSTEPWSRDRRDGFVKAWEATLDICHPIEDGAVIEATE